MWETFINCDTLYMVRLEHIENDFTLLLTDLSYIWESQFSSLNLVNNFKYSNPSIDATEEQILTDLLETLQNLQTVSVSTTVEASEVELVLKKSCDDYSESGQSQQIVYKFRLNRKDQDEFKNKIVVSAIKTIYFLERQQKMLMNLIQKKDRELEEFKMEKGEISRVDLITEKFDANTLESSSKELLLNVFTDEKNRDFWNKFTEKNGEVQTTTLHVELEPWNAIPRKRVIHSKEKLAKKRFGPAFKK